MKKEPDSPDVEQQIDKVFSEKSQQELHMQEVAQEGENQMTNGQHNNTEQIEMEYNKMTNQQKELRMSQGKDGGKSRTEQKGGVNTMEPEDNKPADFDISASKKVETLDSQPILKDNKHLNSKSSLGDGMQNDVTHRQENGEVEKFNQTQGLLLNQYGYSVDSDGNTEIRTNTKLIKAIEWVRKNPLKILIGFLVFLMFFISIFVGIRDGDLGVYHDQMDLIMEEQESINATHQQLDNTYFGLMDSTYSPIYKNAEQIMGPLYTQNDAVESMMKVFETIPDFRQRYGDGLGLSTRLNKAYNDKKRTGGLFFKPLQYEKYDGEVKVPDVKKDMEDVQIDTLGFYQLKRLQVDSVLRNDFCDIDILLVQADHWTQKESAEAARVLKKLEEDPDSEKCCLEYSGSDKGSFQINDYLYGYVRMIQFRNTTNAYADWVFEGQLAGGYNKWIGYGRWTQNAVAVGWWSEARKLKGQGITHTGDHFAFEGSWNGTSMVYPPAIKHTITDLSNQYDAEILKQMKEIAKKNAENPINIPTKDGNN